MALSALNSNLARMVAPVLTGLGLATIGAVATLWTSAGLYLPMLLVASRLTPGALPDAPRSSVLTGTGEGIRHLAGDATAREAMMLTACIAILLRGYPEVLPVMAEGVYDRGPQGFGSLTAAAGAGALIAALAKTSGAGQGGIAPSTRAVLLLGIASFTGLGLSHEWPTVLAWTAILGFASTFCGMSWQAAVQETLPDRLRGRVMSLWVVVGIGAVALGSGSIGLVAGPFGLLLVLIWTGLGGAALAAGLVLPSLRAKAS